jgi:hypothetical protein
LADVVEFAREPFIEEQQAAAPAPTPKPEPPKPEPPKPEPPKPEPPKPEPPKPEPPKVEAPKPEPEAPKPAPEAPAPPVTAPAVTTPVRTPVLEAEPSPVVERRFSPWREPTGSQFQVLAYLRANGRRVLWMVVVPILAAELALGVFAFGPQQYKAVATVNVPAKGSSVSDVTQSVSDYRSQLKSDAVARQVAAQTQVKSGSVKSGVTSKRKGTSGLVEVTYSSSKKASVNPVLRAVTREALSALIQPEVDVAERALQKAQDDLAGVQQEIIAFNAAHGLLLNPPDAYRAKVAELGRLQVQAQQAAGTPRKAALDAAVAQATKEVDSLGAIVRDYQKLQTKHDQLQSTINSSSNKLSDAQARIAASNASSTIDVGGVTKVNALARVARAAAITFVVGLLLMVGLLVLLEVLGYGAATGQGVVPASGATAAPRPAAQPVSSRRRSNNSKKKRR